MEGSQIDSFFEYVVLIDESSIQFSPEQVKKLETIQTKVREILRTVQQPNSPDVVTNKPGIAVLHKQTVMSERLVNSFEEYIAINETIKKRGNNWVVLDKSGKKVLGTHPTHKKALKQLQAIEISKHSE
jgi:hypothetical protein